MSDFTNRIDELLTKKGLTRVQLLRDVGLSEGVLRGWRMRNAIPSGDVCLKIAEYLDVTVEYLLTGKVTYTLEGINWKSVAEPLPNPFLDDFNRLSTSDKNLVKMLVAKLLENEQYN